MSGIREIMLMAPVIPVLVIEDARDAIPIAEALVEGGLRVLEITLRTAAALDVLSAMASVPGAFVGAGTVLNAQGVDASVQAGARFIVSPGLTQGVAHAARGAGVPLLPGVATAGDIMRGLDLGLEHFKFFPAEAAGGLRALKALAAPFGAVRFCPTGGVTAATAGEWLAHPSVLCVGGSWLVQGGVPDLTVIRDRAREAASLGRGFA
jgi:2-dehydro-3-deoxyphosphogluconate aldolase/(4S)-4-hydroxy-2-oxoglutarate aldolase